MIKKLLFFLPLFFLLFFGCKKQEKPNATFTLTANTHGSTSVLLNWTPSNLTGFKDVSIYRSKQPIPDPTFDKPIDGNLQIALISDNSVVTFLDSSIQVGSTGTVYYKVVINLSDRFIVSNQAQASLNAFALLLPSNNTGQFSNSFIFKRIPEINMIYIYDLNQGILTAVDYTQRKIVAATNSIGFNSNRPNIMYACLNNNNPEVFVYLNGTIICYNGLTLAQKYSFSIYSNFYDFKVKDGLLYELMSYGNGYNINTYNLSNFNLVNQIGLPYGSYINNNSNNNVSLFVSNKSSTLFVKYYTNIYNNQTGNYSYTNKLVMYSIANGIPTSITNLNIAALNQDTTNSNNTYYSSYIQVSPDGKYIACNTNGDIYNMIDNSVHNTGNSFSNTIFSNDGSYMLKQLVASSGTGQISDGITVYGLPGFNSTTSLVSQRATSTNLFDDFMDNDTLISYNINQTFVNSQSVNTLTVLFKKVD